MGGRALEAPRSRRLSAPMVAAGSHCSIRGLVIDGFPR